MSLKMASPGFNARGAVATFPNMTVDVPRTNVPPTRSKVRYTFIVEAPRSNVPPVCLKCPTTLKLLDDILKRPPFKLKKPRKPDCRILAAPPLRVPLFNVKFVVTLRTSVGTQLPEPLKTTWVKAWPPEVIVLA